MSEILFLNICPLKFSGRFGSLFSGSCFLFSGPIFLKKASEACSRSYSKAPFFARYFDELMDLLVSPHPSLATLNITLIRYLQEQLGIETPLAVASKLGQELGTKSARLVRLCQLVRADTYLSGQGARAYNDEALFASKGIRLEYQQFKCPVYPQLHGTFVPNLSAVDLLFNCGPESHSILGSA